jgi:uncharacterized delta-60 repeat protein
MKKYSVWEKLALLTVASTCCLINASYEERSCPREEFLAREKKSKTKAEAPSSKDSRASGTLIQSLLANDVGFSSDGVANSSGQYGVGYQDVALQGDGKVVSVGGIGTSHKIVERYLSNGALDTSFSADGLVSISSSSISYGYTGVALEGNGKIIAAGGFASNWGPVFELARFLSNGALDTSFSGDGKQSNNLSGDPDYLLWALTQSDGKILVGGGTGTSPSAVGVVSRYLSNGELDAGFNGTGTVLTAANVLYKANAAAIQSDGKILVTGGNLSHVIQRYLSNGALDTSFSGDGEVAEGYSGSFAGRALGLQADGKIIMGALGTDANIYRYLSNGVLDTSFGSSGRKTVDLGSTTDVVWTVTESAGVIRGFGSGTNNAPYAFRLISNGALDTSFSGDGIAYATGVVGGRGVVQGDGKLTFAGVGPVRFLSNGELDIDSQENGNGILVQADSKIVVAGKSHRNVGILRFLVNGALDTSFDADGTLTSSLASGSSAVGLYQGNIALQGDSKLLVAGSTGTDFSIYRYLSNGALDAGFDSDGQVSTDVTANADVAYSVTTQSDGKILAAGTVGDGSANAIGVVRYLSNGALDTSFSADGKQTTSVSYRPAGRCIVVQADGKSVVVGDDESDLAVVRYLSNGSLDAGFSGDGIVTTNVNGTDRGYGCATQADGKILASGYSSCWGYFMARYLSNGVLDTSFSLDGKKVVPTVGVHTRQDIKVLSDGKILGVGTRGSDAAVMRFLSNGVLDSGFGNEGIQTVQFLGTTNGYNGIASLSDGRLIAVGSNGQDYLISRCLSCGKLDSSFGSGREEELTLEQVLDGQIGACYRDKDYLEDLYWANRNSK